MHKRVIALAAALGGAVLCAGLAHADDDGAGFLSGSTEALVMGPSAFPTPDAEYLSSADQIYLNPLGFPTDGTTLALTTPETDGNFGPSVTAGETDLTNAVLAEWHAGDFSASDPLTIMGYSQSAVIASQDEQTLANDGIPSDALRFVLIGDTSSAEGGFLNTWGDTPIGREILTLLGDSNLIDSTTPDNLYPTEVFTLQGDGWADWDNGANLLGLFSTHLEYFGLTAQDIASAALTNVDGLTNYYGLADPANLLETLLTAAMNAGLG
jgi:PE-PPE domain